MKKQIASSTRGIPSSTPLPHSEAAGTGFRIEKLSLSLTVVSDAGREAALSFSGTGQPTPPQPLEQPSENGDVLHIRPGAPMSEVEEAYIRLVLSRAGNKRSAARILGISPHTLSNKLRAFADRKAKISVPTQ